MVFETTSPLSFALLITSFLMLVENGTPALLTSLPTSATTHVAQTPSPHPSSAFSVPTLGLSSVLHSSLMGSPKSQSIVSTGATSSLPTRLGSLPKPTILSSPRRSVTTPSLGFSKQPSAGTPKHSLSVPPASMPSHQNLTSLRHLASTPSIVLPQQTSLTTARSSVSAPSVGGPLHPNLVMSKSSSQVPTRGMPTKIPHLSSLSKPSTMVTSTSHSMNLPAKQSARPITLPSDSLPRVAAAVANTATGTIANHTATVRTPSDKPQASRCGLIDGTSSTILS